MLTLGSLESLARALADFPRDYGDSGKWSDSSPTHRRVAFVRRKHQMREMFDICPSPWLIEEISLDSTNPCFRKHKLQPVNELWHFGGLANLYMCYMHVCVHVCIPMCAHVCTGQRRTIGRILSLSTLVPWEFHHKPGAILTDLWNQQNLKNCLSLLSVALVRATTKSNLGRKELFGLNILSHSLLREA